MCPFYEYPTHNNQHAFFSKMFIIMLSTIDTLQLYWMILMIYKLIIHGIMRIIQYNLIIINLVMSIIVETYIWYFSYSW